MKIANTLGYFLLIVLLIILGPVIQSFQLWTAACNWTIPWLCSAMALGLCVVFLSCLLSGQEFAKLNKKYLLFLYVPIVLVAGVGIAVDSYSPGPLGNDEFFVCMAEWLGFAVILLAFLLAPRFLSKEENNT